MITVRYRPLSILLAVLALSVTTQAQYTTASLGGSVIDRSGAVLFDTKVTVPHLHSGFKQTVGTDASGAFLFTRLPVGNYTLQAERTGFSSYQQTGLRLTVNQAASQTITMQVGEISEHVNVAGDTERVNTRTGTVEQLVDQKREVELPLT